MEASPGIEPGCTDLQSAASPLRHEAIRRRVRPKKAPDVGRTAALTEAAGAGNRRFPARIGLSPLRPDCLGPPRGPISGRIDRSRDSPSGPFMTFDYQAARLTMVES